MSHLRIYALVQDLGNGKTVERWSFIKPMPPPRFIVTRGGKIIPNSERLGCEALLRVPDGSELDGDALRLPDGLVLNADMCVFAAHTRTIYGLAFKRFIGGLES